MAQQTKDSDQLYARVSSDILAGDIKPFYLLFGKEHYYIDKVCDLLMEKVLLPEERDFGQIVYFGADVTPDKVVSTARQFPMMVSRQLVVLKEAQMMKKVEEMSAYFQHVMPTTVLVVCYKTPTDSGSSKNIDKRTKFYKDAGSIGEVLEFNPAQDYKMPLWVENFVTGQGYAIDPDAAALFAEFCGTELSKVSLEFEKIKRNLPVGSRISIRTVEENVGLRRDYSVYELTKSLSCKDFETVYKLSSFFAQADKRYPIPVVLAALSGQFIRLMKYHSAVQDNLGRQETASLLGINPFFLKEYETAARNYPLRKTMKVISILREYDYRSKSNARGNASDGELLEELVSRILNT